MNGLSFASLRRVEEINYEVIEGRLGLKNKIQGGAYFCDQAEVHRERDRIAV